ncbi:uncharacterized protein DUF397 [Nocardiopsis sp. Huas11]|uniref:DUF397 domain-containing protein n=1 Tax=Nocardiopsis sp. Huas11 TaxID=2183912 RepID=UPI000EB1E9B9|nr:DUF397 domain-containing protein [Nocardiopsis sp. Huas11]RKS07608.1 uncharacterized protein DUF397 [Nocardiopsis sp. Huas11]
MHSPTDTLTFHKSSYSSTDRDCVEVASVTGGAAVRDTQNSELGHLTFAGAGEWRAFLAVARRDSL